MQRKRLHYLSKLAVGFLVRFPLEVEGASVAQFALQIEGDVVEQLPQHAVAEAIVVKIHLQRPSLCHANLDLVKSQSGSLQHHLGVGTLLMIMLWICKERHDSDRSVQACAHMTVNILLNMLHLPCMLLSEALIVTMTSS